MNDIEYVERYWYIHKAKRHEFEDKKECRKDFIKRYGREPRPSEIALKRMALDVKRSD